MSSLRPESNKIHSLGSDNYRWSKLFVGGIDANESVKITNTNVNEKALIITGSMSLKSGGDISLYDSGHNDKEYKVLETLLLLSNSLNTPNTIDETNLLHLSGVLNETISSYKTFSGGLELKLLPNVTYTISGTIDSDSNDGSIATTKWVTDKLAINTISDATQLIAGKVKLASNEQYISGTNFESGSIPLVVQPAYIKQKFESILSQLVNGLNYKGALSITSSSLPDFITGSNTGDFYYINTSGSVPITGSDLQTTSSIYFDAGNLLVFKKDVTSGSLNTTQFDLIQNSLNFQSIKNQLVSGNVSEEEYYANSLYSKGLKDVDSNINYIHSDFIKKSGFIALDTDGNGINDAASFDFKDSKNFKVPNFTYSTLPAPDDETYYAINLNTIEGAARQKISISSLKDVKAINEFAPLHSQVLMWNSGSDSEDPVIAEGWYPSTLTFSSQLKGLTDVDIITDSNPPTGRSTLSDGHILIYSGTIDEGKWITSASIPLSTRIAYTSGSSTNISGSFQTFFTRNIFTNGLDTNSFWVSSSLDTGSDLTDYQGYKLLPAFNTTTLNQSTNGPYLNNRILTLSRLSDVPNIEWVTKKSLKRVITKTITNPNTNINLLSNATDTNSEYNKLKLDETIQNFHMFNDFIWIFNINDNAENLTVTLPTYEVWPYDMPSALKTGFTLTIKNIPISTWDINSPEKYTISIKPLTGQYIDGIINDTIPLVPYSSISFVVSDKSALGWIII